VVLEFLDPSGARLLDLLDGSRTAPEIIRAARELGYTRIAVIRLLRKLAGAGYLTDRDELRLTGLAEPTRRRLQNEAAALAIRAAAGAGTIRRRNAAAVLITGTSPLAVPIATTLACAGVGHLDLALSGVARQADAAPAGLLPSDAYRARAIAAAEAIRRCAPDVDLTPLRPAGATFAVVVGQTEPAALTALTFGSRRLPHLAVAVRDAAVLVGPLVLPGRTACLNCLDLHRQDLDPAWRQIAAQLHTAPVRTEPVTATTALAATAFAAAEVLAHIDGGRPSTISGTAEIIEPGTAVHQRWRPHPRCGCLGCPEPTASTNAGTGQAALIG
jgi:bacteriocin biosynthesis cyclodehydratase domain-containing protein